MLRIFKKLALLTMELTSLILLFAMGLIAVIVVFIAYYAFEIALFLLAGGFLYWAIDRTF
jgi:hypothetical protein